MSIEKLHFFIKSEDSSSLELNGENWKKYIVTISTKKTTSQTFLTAEAIHSILVTSADKKFVENW